MNQEIIKLAIDGGYDRARWTYETAPLLDKEFWIALGKSLELRGKYFRIDHWNPLNDDTNEVTEVEAWQDKAHQFLDARFQGKETEFWDNLLSK